MTHRHAVVVVCVVVAVLLSPTVMAQETATPTQNATNESSDTAGFGTQLTAFAQSSAAEANDSVENGMWQARFEQANASQRAQLVTNRTGTLEQRLERLQTQNATLTQQSANGSLQGPAAAARQSQLNTRIGALRTAVNDTDNAATEAGVNDSRLESLSRNANSLTGQQVAGVARGLGRNSPASQAGPPDRSGNGSNGANGNSGQANGSDSANGNSGQGNGSDSANGNSEQGNGSDSASGNGGGGDGSSGNGGSGASSGNSGQGSGGSSGNGGQGNGN